MRNKPSKKTFTINGWFTGGFFIVKTSKSSKKLEKFIESLGRLEIASEYYEDYDCEDADSYYDLLYKKGELFTFLKHARFRKKGFPFHIRSKRNIELSLTRELIILGRRTQSHQLVQALELVQRIGKYPYPSSYLIDSS